MTHDYKQVGVIGVDAGLCWIGDPCYILHKDQKGIFADSNEKKPKDIGKDWSAFCDRLHLGDDPNPSDFQKTIQFNYDLGHPGLGVCVETGYGDGEYPVFVKYDKDGRVAEVKVIFIDEDDLD